MVGDIYKNFQVFKLKDKAELMKEKQDDASIITLKKRFASKLDCHCKAIHPFAILPDAETNLQ